MAISYECQNCGFEYDLRMASECPKCDAAPFEGEGSKDFDAFRDESPVSQKVDSRADSKKPNEGKKKPNPRAVNFESISAAKVSRTQSKVIERYMSGIQFFGILIGLAIAVFGVAKVPTMVAKVAFVVSGLLIAASTYISAALTRMIAAYINFRSLEYLEKQEK
jgi:predicted ATP-dependent serine protease